MSRPPRTALFDRQNTVEHHVDDRFGLLVDTTGLPGNVIEENGAIKLVADDVANPLHRHVAQAAIGNQPPIKFLPAADIGFAVFDKGRFLAILELRPFLNQ